MPTFTLHLSLHEAGGAEAHVMNGEESLEMYPSYIFDPLSTLTDAALSLLRAPMLDEVVVSWMTEPGEWRWVVHRVGDVVRLEIWRFDEDCFPLPNKRGERVFSTECALLRFATQVKGQMHRMLNEYGEKGYLTRWQHPFPMQTFRQLEAHILLAKQRLK